MSRRSTAIGRKKLRSWHNTTPSRSKLAKSRTWALSPPTLWTAVGGKAPTSISHFAHSRHDWPAILQCCFGYRSYFLLWVARFSTRKWALHSVPTWMMKWAWWVSNYWQKLSSSTEQCLGGFNSCKVDKTTQKLIPWISTESQGLSPKLSTPQNKQTNFNSLQKCPQNWNRNLKK